MAVPTKTVTPAHLRSFLMDHIVKKTKDLGSDTLSNGELLRAAEEAAFEVFLTTDKNIRQTMRVGIADFG